MSVAQEIKDKLDIVDYIRLSVPSLKKAGRYWKACCPFHNEKTPSFVVNPDTQSWRCFGQCAEGGDIFNFAMKLHGWTFSETLNELGRVAGVEVRQQSPQQKAENEHHDLLRGMLQKAADIYHEYLLSDKDVQSRAALAYVREKRGFQDETIVRFQMGCAPEHWTAMLDQLKSLGYKEDDIIEAGLATKSDSGRVYDRFRNRLMIPIRDERGRVVGFGARALDPEEKAKYINSSQGTVFDKSRLLFGLDVAKRSIQDSGVAVIVEGYMDVIQAHQAGYTNVVAQMGTAMTEAQLKLIAPRYAQQIILGLDQDAAGQNATRRSLEVARETLSKDYAGRLSIDIRILQIEGAKDPDDVLRETPEKWAQYVEAALPVADFVIDMETAQLKPNAGVAEKQAIASRILPILTASESDMYRHANIQRLALRLRVSENDLLIWAAEMQSRQKPASYEHRALSEGDVSEEPPGFDSLPPPDYEGRDYEDDEFDPYVPPPARAFTSQHVSHAAEIYCLRMILRRPGMIARANRKLRELANGDTELMGGPLSAISAADFSQTELRSILVLLQEALSQDEQETLDYLRSHLDGPLLNELNRLLREDTEELEISLGRRFHGEFDTNIKTFRTRVLPSLDLDEDLMRRLLEVRIQRLRREREEIQFLMQDASIMQDRESEHHFFRQVGPQTRALHLIENEIQRNKRFQ